MDFGASIVNAANALIEKVRTLSAFLSKQVLALVVYNTDMDVFSITSFVSKRLGHKCHIIAMLSGHLSYKSFGIDNVITDLQNILLMMKLIFELALAPTPLVPRIFLIPAVQLLY